MKNRRDFLKRSGMMALGGLLLPRLSAPAFSGAADPTMKKFKFEISLAEFSFAPELLTGKMTNLDFPARAKNEFGIDVLEYVSMFFNDKHTDTAYLRELKQRCDDQGMINHLIMVDGANIADLDATQRRQAVEDHYAWVDAAKFLGCTAIRVNLGDVQRAITGAADDPPAEAAKAAADGYRQLLEYAADRQMNVIVENHFGNSTDIDWLVGIMRAVDMPNAGLLPDFGNFCRQRTRPATSDLKDLMNTKCLQEYDRYEGVKKMLPYAKGISAKTHQFDAKGNDTETDFFKMFKLIKAAGFQGYVGIEYEGGFRSMYDPMSGYLPSADGIRATKRLLERVRKKV